MIFLFWYEEQSEPVVSLIIVITLTDIYNYGTDYVDYTNIITTQGLLIICLLEAHYTIML